MPVPHPNVTPPPSAALVTQRLFDRQDAVQTCGWVSRDPGEPATCAAGSTCAVNTDYNVHFCCPSFPCTPPTTCLGFLAVQTACDSACQENPLILRCPSGYNYCYTRTWHEVTPLSGFGCATSPFFEDVYTTNSLGIGQIAAGSTFGLSITTATTTSSALPISTAVSSSTSSSGSTSESGSSSSLSSSLSPSSASSLKSTSVSSFSSTLTSTSSLSSASTSTSSVSSTSTSSLGSSSSTSSSATISGSNSGPGTNTQIPSSSSWKGGKIAGVVIGSIAGVAIVAYIFWLAVKWRRSRLPHSGHQQQIVLDDFLPGPPAQDPREDDADTLPPLHTFENGTLGAANRNSIRSTPGNSVRSGRDGLTEEEREELVAAKRRRAPQVQQFNQQQVHELPN